MFRVLWWSPLRKRDVVKHRGNESWQLQLHEVLLGHSLNLGGDGELRQLCGSLRMSDRCTGTVGGDVELRQLYGSRPQRLVFVRRAAAAVACVCDNDHNSLYWLPSTFTQYCIVLYLMYR